MRASLRLILISLLAALTLTACATTTDDGAALEVQTSEGQIDGFFDFEVGTSKSFALFACSNVDSLILESVDAISSEGEIEFLGAVVYEADAGFIGAVEGYPPSGIKDEYLFDLGGYDLEVSCDEAEPEVKAQIVLGADRTGPGGGKIQGIEITHSEGVLRIEDYQIVLCGDEYEYCEGLRPES